MSIHPTDLMSATLSEPDLVRRAANQDKRAFKILFRRYQDSIRSMATRMMRDADAAEDVVQETFLKTYSKLSTLKNPDVFGAWLKRVAHQACIDHHRKRERLKRLYSKLQGEKTVKSGTGLHAVASGRSSSA